jgi:hypothetical protein
MNAPVAHLPIAPIPGAAEWEKQLQQIARGSLEFCADFPTIARRFEAWWAQEIIDRPIFLGAANRNPQQPITRRLELLEQPERWLEAKFQDLLQTHCVGDALPSIRVDFGPVLLGGLLGGRVTFDSDTTWTHALIGDDWSNAPDWTIPDDGPWWGLLQELTRRTAEHAAGRFLVRTPDLGGSGDVLLNLRGSAALCTDVIDNPSRVREAVDAIYPSWQRAFSTLYRITLERGAGIIHWLGIWSDRPYMIPACDFNALIGPRPFETLFLPDIARQAETAGRAIFHLDGPDAARHIDALLEVLAIQAIQFTPGAGTPSALAWVDMFRKIQRRGRSLFIVCPDEEVLELCEALPPQGLAIMVEGSLSPEDLDALFAAFERRWQRGTAASVN